MQNKKQYRLKKEILNWTTGHIVPIGEVFEPGPGTTTYYISKNGWKMCSDAILNDGWFEPVLPVSNEGARRIEVTKFGSSAMRDHGHWYTFHVAGTGNKFMYDIPEDKFPAIKRAIEYVLNDDSAVKSFPLSQADVEIFKTSTGLRYTQQEMDAARTEAFWAAREKADNHIGTIRFHDDGAGMYYYPAKFTTANDYLSTLSMSKEPAPAPADKAEGEKDWEVVKYKNGKLGVHDPVTIRHFDCVTKKCAIHSVRRINDGEVFTVGDEVYDYRAKITGFAIVDGELMTDTKHGEKHSRIPAFWLLKKPSSTPEQKSLSCNMCGGGLVLIRGRYPNTDKREVCPTCATERLEQIHEMSDKNYGQAYKSKQQ